MIKILIAGLPGEMATTFVKHALKEKEIEIINHSITGVDTEITECIIDGSIFKLIRANDKERINKLFNDNKSIIVVDYTEPLVVESNIDLYCRKKVNFIMGTTGVVINKVFDKIVESDICAIIAPNMGKQIVAMQAMIEYAAENFPDCFKNYKLTIRESHQSAKLDTSGTARAMIGFFNKLGMKYCEDEIIKHRKPNEQIELGVPEEHLNGHGWHTYTFSSADESIYIEITHNVNGRDIYAKGTVDSIYYLDAKIKNGVKGAIFQMIDVLKNM